MNPKSADLLRITALFLVILLHVAASAFGHFHDAWEITTFYGSLSRVCIPLFFMLSGALLLNKTETIKLFFMKRAGKIIVPTLFWSFAYLFYRKYVTGPINSSVDPAQILKGPTYYHLWFMYAIITLYIATPLLRVFNLHATRELKWYVVTCWFLAYSVIPWFSWNSDINFEAGLGFIPKYAGFMLLGSLLSEYADRVRPVFSIFLFAAGSFLTFVLTVWYSVETGAPNERFYAYVAPNVIMAAAGLYLLLNQAGEKLSGKTAKRLNIISECTFGIYLVHVIIMDTLINDALKKMAGTDFNNIYSVINIPVIAICCAVISFIVILSIKKMPLLKHVA